MFRMKPRNDRWVQFELSDKQKAEIALALHAFHRMAQAKEARNEEKFNLELGTLEGCLLAAGLPKIDELMAAGKKYWG